MTKKNICARCIATAKAVELNEVPMGEIATCDFCSEHGYSPSKYGFSRQLNDEQVAYLRDCQQKEADRKAKSVADFQKRKKEAELEEAKVEAERKARREAPVVLRSISL